MSAFFPRHNAVKIGSLGVELNLRIAIVLVAPGKADSPSRLFPHCAQHLFRGLSRIDFGQQVTACMADGGSFGFDGRWRTFVVAIHIIPECLPVIDGMFRRHDQATLPINDPALSAMENRVLPDLFLREWSVANRCVAMFKNPQ